MKKLLLLLLVVGMAQASYFPMCPNIKVHRITADTSPTQKNGGEDVLSYNGTASLAAGDTLTLQYYLDDNTIDFTSNAVFAHQVAYTLWLVRCGN